MGGGRERMLVGERGGEGRGVAMRAGESEKGKEEDIPTHQFTRARWESKRRRLSSKQDLGKPSKRLRWARI